MAKNFKGKAHKTPLSAADIAIYIAAILLLLAFDYCSMFLFGEVFPEKLAFTDPNVLACRSEGIFFVFPFLIYFGGVLPCVMIILAGRRMPLLGNPRYKAPAFSHIIKPTPVFSRKFRQSLSDSQKKNIRSTVRILLAGLLISLLLLPFSLFPRFVFTQQHEFVTYDAFNRVTEQYRLADTTHLGIEARYYNGKNVDTYLGLNFVIPGAEELVRLDPDLFSRMTTEDALKCLLELKSLFPSDACQFWGTEDLERVIAHRDYTPAEAALVYQLFDMTP